MTIVKKLFVDELGDTVQVTLSYTTRVAVIIFSMNGLELKKIRLQPSELVAMRNILQITSDLPNVELTD